MSGNPTHSCPEHGSRSRGRSLCHSGPRTLLHPCWNWWSFRSIRARSPDRGSKESAKDRAKVQTTMETEVLRLSQYPQVTFESTGLDGSGTADAFRVRGNLTIRGKTQPVILPLTLTHLDDGTYRARGEYKLKQTAFGIQPIQLAGGTVKVKDEVRTEFELFLK
jgi:polyisoprenoid-binding protein YceI